MQLTQRSGLNARSRGFTLIEILVTIVILLIGLLGVIAMQSRAATVEFESYQRGQALALVRDMQARLAASRAAVDKFDPAGVNINNQLKGLSSTNGSVYVGSSTKGVDCSVAGSTMLTNLCAWGEALQGDAAVEGGASVGAMIGARGCLIRLEPPQGNALADLYIVVVWQGMAAGTEPPADSPAGTNGCASDIDFGTGLRRGVTMRVLIPNLTKQV